ncbi:MAG: NUDIX domain-containing protein [Kiritimatiellae bacterium]|nr:NUDIX domain-containing protein [Kiritimatiellia bacterium]
MKDELFDLVDREGNVIGQAPRSQCHANPALIHQAVHVAVFNHASELFLQKRVPTKEIQPDKWDISVGGHVQAGEAPLAGAIRELREELGVANAILTKAYEYIWESSIETELIRTFVIVNEGPFILQADEIADGRFWALDEIVATLPSGFASPQFQHEFPQLREWWKREQSRVLAITT